MGFPWLAACYWITTLNNTCTHSIYWVNISWSHGDTGHVISQVGTGPNFYKWAHCKAAQVTESSLYKKLLLVVKVYFLVWCFTCATDSFEQVHWCIWHRFWLWVLIVEWRNPFKKKDLHWSQVRLEPRSSQLAKTIEPPRHKRCLGLISIVERETW